MSKMFQINADDLAALESLLPELCDALYPVMDNRMRAKIRQVQRVMSSVRWNYGPPAEVEVVPSGDDQVS